MPNKRLGQNSRYARIFLLNLKTGGGGIKQGVRISKNQLISVMNEKRDINA